jgi:protein-S-isoprenylcysteine O-methyltransferase Ste14
MEELESKIPPLAIVLFVALLMYGSANSLPRIEIGFLLRMGITVFIFCLGAFFCLASVFSFKRAKTTVNPMKPATTSSLVSTGIYQISRNPMYVGFTLFLAAWAIYLESLWSSFGVLGFIVYMNQFQIKPEERALQSLFGNEFADYQSRVRRWF